MFCFWRDHMENRTQITMRVSRRSIAANVLLSVVKLLSGVLARSGAMVSDAIHSASDVVSTIIVMIGVKASEKASDREHPYGHERMECVAAIVLSAILMATGLLVGWSGVEKIVHREDLPVPGIAALFAAVLSIAVKEGMFWYTRHYARSLDSEALMADAWHHRSDALSSVGALLGIAGARLGYPILDPLSSVVICVFIGKAAIDIFRDAVDKMVDHSCDEATERAIRGCVMGHEGVEHIDLLRTREFGNRIYIELEISVDGQLPLVDAHAIAERVHNDVEMAFPQVKHIMIHVNPA
ncbi:MAG: cation transporter [Oscillospiraceae bacterium]|nr:cation transporter [Oscillospiraceae bacterium]